MKRLKQLLSCLLVFAMVSSIAPTVAFAVEDNNIVTYAVEGGNIYFDTSTGSIIDCDKSVLNATIPKQIKGITVTAIENRNSGTFADCIDLRSINLPDSITFIDESAFWNCSSLISINLPEGITSIGDWAFWKCSSLKNINIPNSVVSIGFHGFQGCHSLNSINIPDGISDIGGWTFEGCHNLNKIRIPNSITFIGYRAFYGCSNLTDIYYGGNEDNWNAIYIGEEGAPPESAIIHYNSADFGNTDIPTISGFSASKDGWCLTNTHATFGYDNNYHIPAERYYETFGISLSSLCQSLASLSKWGGSCFGLSILAAANYNNQINLQPFFTNKGENLYQYGYNHIDYTDEGKQFFSISKNNEIIKMIERAQLSQKSTEFPKSEVFKKDSKYSALLEYLNGINPAPLLVGLDLSHAVVIDTSIKPIELEQAPGWYYIALYDSNAPSYSEKLSNPAQWYQQNPSYLLVDTTTGQWQYWCNGKCQKSMTYYCLGLQNIRFYDINILGKSYFQKPLTLWGNWITIDFSASDFCIKDTDENILFQVQDNSVVNVSDTCDFYPTYDSNENVFSGTVSIPYESFEYISNSSNVSIYSGEFLASLSNSGLSNTLVDLKSKTVTVTSDKYSEVAIALQNGLHSNDYTAIEVESILDNSSLVINATDSTQTKVESSATSAIMDIRVENPHTGITSYPKISAEDIDYIDTNLAELHLKSIPVTAIALDKSNVILSAIGATEELIAMITPDDATNKSIVWTSSNPKIAIVNQNGVITAVSEGQTVITVATEDRKYCATCLVSVSLSNNGGSKPGSNEISHGSSTTTTLYKVDIPHTQNGKISVSPSNAKKGDTVTISVTPDTGYKLDKLTVADSKGNTLTVSDKGNGKYTFIMPDSKVTVTPTFIPEATKPVETRFVDVADNAWYAEAVNYVADKGMMNGIGENKFAPNATTTRGMLMTVLARYAGQDTSDSNPWYQKGMDWAVNQKVSDGTNPTANITREQLVTMLYRYAGSPVANGSLSDFSDTAAISDYAVSAMQWAVANSIVNGANGKLNPKNNATRAEVAAILMRFCEMNK